MLMFGRNQHNSVNQVSFNLEINKFSKSQIHRPPTPPQKKRIDFIASCAQTPELVAGGGEDWPGLEKHENCLKLKSYSRFRLYL